MEQGPSEISSPRSPSTPALLGCQSSKETPTERTAKRLAYGLLSIYGAGLLAIAVFAALSTFFSDETSAGAWLDLLKSGFLILGGALSAVVGYYFGSRGIQEAERRARDVELTVQRRTALDEEAPTLSDGFDEDMLPQNEPTINPT